MYCKVLTTALALGVSFWTTAQIYEPVAYGDFDSWVTRNIRESRIIGGQEKVCYAVGPERTVDGDDPYEPQGGTPWASSNVMAKVVGITKVSNAVFPDVRGNGRCAKLTTMLDHCKALGLINIDVLVAGTLFLGRMLEPVTSTDDPYSKMEMGVPFTRRPSALVFDYKLSVPEGDTRLYSSGFGKKRTLQGADKAEAFILLQRRWEDSEGNIHARRVGTGRELLEHRTDGWQNGHALPVHYGDIRSESFFRPYMGLISEENSYYARNSRGEMVPVVEEGWDDDSATPTHMLMMFSAGSGEAYVGTPGLTLWVDNVKLRYDGM